MKKLKALVVVVCVLWTVLIACTVWQLGWTAGVLAWAASAEAVIIAMLTTELEDMKDLEEMEEAENECGEE